MAANLMRILLAGLTAGPATFWGGNHIEIEVTAGGVRVEFDCAHGTIEAPLPERPGTFEIKGTFVPERSGPSRGDTERAFKATYRGSISHETMTLRVIVEGQDPEGTSYELTRGRRGDLRKCRGALALAGAASPCKLALEYR